MPRGNNRDNIWAIETLRLFSTILLILSKIAGAYFVWWVLSHPGIADTFDPELGAYSIYLWNQPGCVIPIVLGLVAGLLLRLWAWRLIRQDKRNNSA
jgi:hypothetical protein